MTTRRTVLSGAAALAGAALLGGRAGGAPGLPAPGRAIVIRQATVVSMDPAIGVAADTDVLVVDGTIAAVGKRLPTPTGAFEIQAQGALLHPGFVDTHRHLWQGAFRGAAGNWTRATWLSTLMNRWAKLFRPEDIYATTYFGMIDAVNDGVTTVMNWAHNHPTPDHVEASVDALFAAPGRARFGCGNFTDPSYQWLFDGQVDQLLATRFARRDQRVTLQLAIDFGAPDDMVRALGFANQRHLPVSLHCGAFGTPTDDQIRFLDDQKFLTPSCTLVHADTLSDDSYRRIAAGGAYLSVSAESESGYGQGYPAVVKAVQLGVPWSLSIDNISQLSGDMYTAMRATLIADHLEEHREAHQQGQQLTGLRLRSSDVLAQATIGGARALGLDAVTGSITPGKAADLVLLRPDTLAMTPAADPIGSTVHQAGRGDVDTVLVGGQLCKFRGELVGVDVGHARQLMQQTFSYLRSRITDADWAQAINPT